MKKLIFILIIVLFLVSPTWATVKYLIPRGAGTYTQWTGAYTTVDDTMNGTCADDYAYSNGRPDLRETYNLRDYNNTSWDDSIPHAATTVVDSITTTATVITYQYLPFNIYPIKIYRDSAYATPVASYDTIQVDDTLQVGHSTNVHLDIYYNSAGWNGYKYWMAYTPYFNGTAGLENPYIVVSQDGTGWIKPCGTSYCNRLDVAEPPPLYQNYNSDVDLIHSSNDSLYVIWRHSCFTCSPSSTYVKVSASGDGTTWTTPTITFRGPNNQSGDCRSIVSPALVISNTDSTVYRMYAVNAGCGSTNFDSFYVEYTEASSPRGSWGSWHKCYIKQGGLSSALGHPWHINVTARPDLNTYHFIILGYRDVNPEYSLYFGWSNSAGDTIYINPNRTFLAHGVSGNFDDTWNYRSALVLYPDSSMVYRLFYIGYGGSGTKQYRMGHTRFHSIVESLVPNIYENRKMHIFGYK